MELVLQLAELIVAAHERGLERLGTVPAAAFGDDPQGPPRGDGRRLALEGLVASGLEGDRLAGGPLGRLAHEDRPGRRDRLEAGRRVDEVARHHALVRRTEGDRGLAGQDADARLDRRPQRAHRVDQVQARPDRALGVILAGGRRTPHGHHRVADELLDGAPVQGDDAAGQVEVAGQELPGVLRVATIRERGEADEVGEQDGDEPPFGDWCGSRVLQNDRGRRDDRALADRQPRPALVAEGRIGGIRPAAGRATDGEARPAPVAELAPRHVLRPAARAEHWRSLLRWTPEFASVADARADGQRAEFGTTWQGCRGRPGW